MTPRTVVLRFGFVEGDAVVRAQRAVYDPQSSEMSEAFGSNGSRAERLAVVLNEDEARAIDGSTNVEALLKLHGAEVVVIKRGPHGATVHEPGKDAVHVVPYRSETVFKIGSGDVFSAAFALYWGERGVAALAAADMASRSVATFVDGHALPLNEALNSFDDLGVDVVSPYDLGLDGFPSRKEDVGSVLDDCDAVLALAEGADIPAVLAVGLARIRRLPIVILAEQSNGRRLDLWEGTNCEIAGDFASAVYRTMVAGKGRATA